MNERPDPPQEPEITPVPRRLLRPLQQFLETSTASGTLLLIAAVLALAWANSPWGSAYEELWSTPSALRFGDRVIGEDLRHWVNDGLMTLFFLVVGLEIKREFLTGELREWRAAALPVVAAVGGMLVPALIYLALNAGGLGVRGWGIPMATDIAFALGVLLLAARHAPPGLRPFILTLAIVDDIGAILVIALFYSEGIALGSLLIAAAVCVLMRVLWRVGIGSTAVFVGLGVIVWLATYVSGVHPTIAGVVLGLLVPAEDPREPVPPLAGAEQALLPWTSFLIVPLFAFANAGVNLSGDRIADALSSPVTLGVLLGLVIGKVAGISGAAALALWTRFARLPAGVRAPHLAGAAAVAGIGFTVSLLMAELAFDDRALIDEAKVGILAASVVSGALGWVLLRAAPAVDGEGLSEDQGRRGSGDA